MKMSRVHCSGHLNAIRTTERPHQLSTLSPRYTPVLQRPNGLMQPGHNEVEKTSLGCFFFFFHRSEPADPESGFICVWTGTGWNVWTTLCVIQKLNKWTKHWLRVGVSVRWITCFGKKKDLKEKWGGCFCPPHVHSEAHVQGLYFFKHSDIQTFTSIHIWNYLVWSHQLM